MPDPDFERLRSALVQSGVGAARARRMATEFEDHYLDLVDEGLAAGLDPDVARRRAMESIGSFDTLRAAVAARPELRSWAFRHPRLALLFYPLACAVALPVVPVIAGREHAPELGRWMLCVLAGGIVTAALLLAMQLSITLT